MKRVLYSLVFAFITFAACNNLDTASAGHKNHNPAPASDTAAKESDDVKIVQPVFTALDASVSSHIKTLFDHYIHIKTALVNSNEAEAKKGAAAILQVLKNYDRSLLSTEQKSAYDKCVGGIRTAAEGITVSKYVTEQREYFARLSNNAYFLAKSFGAGKQLYHDNCPMAFNEKGAMWLSEQKEIRNPYLGNEMPECGTVEEVIQKP